MSIRNERRRAAIDRMADLLLEKGMAAASLRPLAAAAGTSDRMLLYYFADKDELLAATLERVALRLTSLLDTAIPAETRLPARELLIVIWRVVGSVELQPYMRLWLELAAASARDLKPHQTIATSIMSGFVAWTSEHLATDQTGERGESAAFLLAMIEGALFLDAVGRRDLAEAAIKTANSPSALNTAPARRSPD